jgi:D-alanyl-D-alanine carboxypeptidase
MKTIITSLFAFSSLFLSAQKVTNSESFNPGVTLNPKYSKAAKLDSVLKHYAPNILTGASIAIYSEAEGWWASASGYADVKNNVTMKTHHLQYLQSVSKMHMAIEILQLKEQGKIDLDKPMTDYLPKKYSKYITDADKITVRMLLNHTSGVPEYNDNPDFLSNVLLHPTQNFTQEEALKGIESKPLMWKPGTKYGYVNTNYMLLSIIGDVLTGDHAKYIKKNIFEPLGLQRSFYGNDYDYLKGLGMPKSYWDVFNAEIPVDVTPLQQMTVVCSKGDDGIVCTTLDAVKFLKGLFEGKLLKPESMAEMMHFVKDENGNNRYGMGIIYFDLNGVPAYGHGGGGIGAGCGLVYIPSKKVYAFFATNTGVFANGTLSDKVGEMKNAIMGILLE